MKMTLGRLRFWMLAIALAAAGIAVIAFRARAQAQAGCSSTPDVRYFGRCPGEGYFTGNFVWDYGGNDLTNGIVGVTNATQFINRLEGYLFTDLTGCPALGTITGPGNSGDPCASKKRIITGAAFIVNSMMGKQGPSFTGVVNGYNSAVSLLPAWEAQVQYLGSQPVNSPNGWIDWTYTRVNPSPVDDWYNDVNGREPYWDRIPLGDWIPIDDITIFHNADGSRYIMIKRCTNVSGEMSPITASGPTPTPTPTPTPVAVALQCVSVSPSTAVPQPNAPFTVTILLQNDTPSGGPPVSAANGYVATVSLSGPGGPYPTQTVGYAPATINPDGGQANGTMGPITVSQSGTYTLTLNFSGAGNSCPAKVSTFTVGDTPFLRAYSGDITAGIAYGGVCSSYVPAGIKTYSEPPGGGTYYGGAAVEYAAYALGAIEGFTSASQRTAAPTGPNGLSVSNTADPPYGGDSNQPICRPDYFAQSNIVPLEPITGIISLASLTAGREYHFVAPDASPIKINGCPAMLSGAYTVYIDGNAIINCDIVFNPNITMTNGLADGNMLFMFVKGDLMVDDSVNRLDGFFAAQPGGTYGTGTIYTCAHGNGTPYTDPVDLYPSACRSSLVINGAISAAHTRFLRVAGSSSLSPTNTPETAGSPNIAETIQFTPDMFIGEPALPPTQGNNTGLWDYATSLPPTL